MHGDGPKKERTKLITPQVAKLEHAYKPGEFLLYRKKLVYAVLPQR